MKKLSWPPQACRLERKSSGCFWPNSAVRLPERIIPAYAPTACRTKIIRSSRRLLLRNPENVRRETFPEIGDEPFLFPYQRTSLIRLFAGPLKAAPCIPEVAE